MGLPLQPGDLGVSPSLLTPNSSHLLPVSTLGVELGSMLPALLLHPFSERDEESRASVYPWTSLSGPRAPLPGSGFSTEMLNTDEG